MDEKTNYMINKRVEDKMNTILAEYHEKSYSADELSKLLLLCAELYDESFDSLFLKKIEYLIGDILKKYKIEIYVNKCINLSFDGMVTGIGNMVLALDILKRKTNSLQQFFLFFLRRLEECVLNQIQNNKAEQLQWFHYDTMYGVSGVLYFLLDTNEANKEVIVELINYIVEIADEKKYNGCIISGFHIEYEQQYTENIKRKYPKGHINFGMAHGMLGPAMVLAKAIQKGYTNEKIQRVVQNILELYNEFSTIDNDVIKFPTMLSFEDYIKGESSTNTFNVGWCYGNSSILRGLMKISKYLNMNELYKYYSMELLKVINQPDTYYNLHSPIVCHGYASIVSMQICAYIETNDERYLNTLNRNVRKMLQEHEKLVMENDKEYIGNYNLWIGEGGVLMTLKNAMKLNGEYVRVLLID